MWGYVDAAMIRLNGERSTARCVVVAWLHVLINLYDVFCLNLTHVL